MLRPSVRGCQTSGYSESTRNHSRMNTTADLLLGRISLGVGDRFAHQAKAQLRACMMAADRGVTVIPVWNKSNREHGIVGSEPGSVKAAADRAARELGWTQFYHVDADHINLATVDRYIEASDFYTLDVAAAIGRSEEHTSELQSHSFIS